MVTRSNAAAGGGDAHPQINAAPRPTSAGAAQHHANKADAAPPAAPFGGVSFLSLLRAQTRRVSRETRATLRPGVLLAFLRRHALSLALTAVGAALLAALCATAWRGLGADAFYVLAVLYVACAAMVAEVSSPDVCLFFACMLYMVKGLITPKETFAGLSNDSIVTIGE